MSRELAPVDEGFGGGLIDTGDLSLADLDELDETSLGHALRWVLDPGNKGPVAGFDSAI